MATTRKFNRKDGVQPVKRELRLKPSVERDLHKLIAKADAGDTFSVADMSNDEFIRAIMGESP